MAEGILLSLRLNTVLHQQVRYYIYIAIGLGLHVYSNTLNHVVVWSAFSWFYFLVTSNFQSFPSGRRVRTRTLFYNLLLADK